MNLHHAGALTCALLTTLIGSWLMTAEVSAAAPEDVARSTGCAAHAAAGSVMQSLTAKDGKGRQRNYLLQLPDGYEAGTPYRLVFVFHALNGHAQEASAGLRDAGDAARSALFVYPQGIEYQHEGVGWDDSAKGYDLPFFDQMLADVTATYCIDKARIFVAGFSWGGDFSTALACTRGEVLRAAVINSASDDFLSARDFRTYQNYPCVGVRHPAILFQHAVDSDEAYPSPLFDTTSQLLRNMNACQAGGAVREPHSPVSACVTYRGCANEVTECFFDHKLGHRRPPGWAQDAWTFLSSF